MGFKGFMRLGLSALALALLAGLTYREVQGRDDGVPGVAAVLEVKPVAQPHAIGREQPLRPNVQVLAVAPSPPRVDIARRRQLERELWLANDWEQFMRENLPLAQAGDAEAQVQVGIAMGFCSQMAKSSATQAGGDTQDEDQAAGLRLLRQRCEVLDKLPQEQLGNARQWFQLSAAQGNGMAWLNLAEDKEGGESPDQRMAELHRAIASSDPSVIEALVMSSIARQDGDNTAGALDSSEQMAAEALTECALGYDCSASGPIYEGLHCKRSGCFHADGVERYYELSMSRQQYADVQAYSQRLVANLRSGDYDWPQARSLESQLLQPSGEGAVAADTANP